VNSPGAKPSDIDLHTYPGLNVSGSPAGDYSVYLMEPHLLFATGGSYLVNWVWKDTAHLVFPWGLTNPNDYTPTKHLIAYRDESFFLRHFQPQFHVPKVLVVVSKAHIEHDESKFTPYLHGTMNALFDHAVQFTVIDDVDLDRIASGPHVLIYPDPEYTSPDVIAKLRARVEEGDDLFLTGGFVQPQARPARNTELFAQLSGLRWLADYPPGSEIPIAPVGGWELLNPYIGRPLSKFQAAGARPLATDSAGNVIVALHEIRGGHVFFSSDASLDGTRRALDAFLMMRQVPSVAMSPKGPNRDIFEVDRVGGGSVYTLAATNPGGQRYTVNGPWIERPESFMVQIGNEIVHLPLGGYGVSLFAVRGDGSIDALEGQGKFSVDGDTLLEAEPHVMAMALDDVALNKSHGMALFALGEGSVSIAAPEDVDLVEVGEPEGARFHVVEEIRTSRREGRLTFQLDDAQARGVLLIASKAQRARARQLMNAVLQ